ncbi:calcium-binding protein [Massilia sp. W12]|uniref:calcium-binding protein n=1 Tax=Massilia sp. W12 TaxID=3126507 RepID=UPI0030CF63F8
MSSYYFNLGSGSSIVSNNQGYDTFVLGSGIASNFVKLTRIDSNLIIKITDSLDILTIDGYYSMEGAVNYAPAQITFTDNALTWTITEINGLVTLGNDWAQAAQPAPSIQAADAISGGDENDTIYGGIGNDSLSGGAGRDRLEGRDGDDILIGGSGIDDLIGDIGKDTLSGGADDDYLFGGIGNDSLIGGQGNDVLDGGDGDDTVDGGSGNDRINGSPGSDTYMFSHGSGNDTVSYIGNFNHNNKLEVQFAADILPSDVLVTRDGNAYLSIHLKTSPDTLGIEDYFHADPTKHSLQSLKFSNGVVWSSADLLSKVLQTGIGNDSITGHAGNDNLQGYEGKDTLFGGDGDDFLDGGADKDLVNGQSGNDTLHGGRDNDTVDGGFGDDKLYGDEHNDSLSGSYGNDTLDGGSGNDTLFGSVGDDVLIFNKGSGQDVISQTYIPPTIENDAIKLGFSTGEVKFARKGVDLYLIDANSQDYLKVENYFSNLNTVTSVHFNDGNVLDHKYFDVNLKTDTNVSDIPGYNNYHGAYRKLVVYQNNSFGSNEADLITVAIGASVSEIDAGAGDDHVTGSSGHHASTDYVVQQLLFGNAGNDLMSGGTGNDVLQGGYRTKIFNKDGVIQPVGNVVEFDDGGYVLFDGDDDLKGGPGNDILIGGSGRDTLDGGPGSDTFLFGKGSGEDQITLVTGESVGSDVVKLLEGVSPADVVLTRSTQDLYLTIKGTRDKLTITSYFSSGTISEIKFANNTTWSKYDIDSKILIGTDDVDTLYAVTGSSIDGLGGADSIAGSTFNDVLSGGSGEDSINGGEGNDILSGGTDTDQLSGQEGADTLDGGSGSDTLDGGVGNDSLSGGTGFDTLSGGAGDDILNGGEGSDVYRINLSDGNDRIIESDSIGNSTDEVIFNFYNVNIIKAVERSGFDLVLRYGDTGKDQLTVVDYFDPSQPGSRVETFKFGEYGTTKWSETDINGRFNYMGDAGNNNLIGSDTLKNRIFGLDGDDTLTGGQSADSLNGGNGNDVLIGKAGNDTLDGGAGIDTADYSAQTSVLNLDLAKGEARPDGSVAVDILSGIENARGGSAVDTMIGDINANKLEGMAGNDILVGGGGADTLDGGTGVDLVDYSAVGNAVKVALWNNRAPDIGGGVTNTLLNIENVRATNFSDFLVGNTGANYIEGMGGNDTLIGEGGADTLDGGAGIDLVDYSAVKNAVKVALWNNRAPDIGGGVINTLLNIENARGTAYNDTLVGSSVANLLEGMGGNDTLVAEGGADTLDGGDGVDTADYSSLTASVDIDLSNKIASNNGAGVSNVLLGIENVLGGKADDTIAGDAASNLLFGNAGNDKLIASIGTDTLDGGDGIDLVDFSAMQTGVKVRLWMGTDAQIITTGVSQSFKNIEALRGSGYDDTLAGNIGANTIEGLGGNDMLISAGGADKLDGGDGMDTVNYAGTDEALQINLSTGTALYIDQKVSNTLLSLENVVGGNSNDLIIGDAGANKLDGGNGNDSLAGAGGADTLDGGAGIDTADYSSASGGVDINLAINSAANNGANFANTVLNMENVRGGAFNDIIAGNALANMLEGGDGDDILQGAGGADTLNGGAGIDTADFRSTSGGVNVNLELNLASNNGENVANTLLNIENVVGGIGNDTLVGSAGDNRLDGGVGNDALQGGAGNDVLVVSIGADTLDGGAGIDQADFSSMTAAVAVRLWKGSAAQDIGAGTLQSFVNIENLAGSAYHDILAGNNGANKIEGQAGNDVLISDGGADTLDGGSGVDTVNYAGTNEALNINLGAGTALYTTKNVSNTLLNLENVVGGNGNDVIIGDAAVNKLEGGAGNDNLTGGNAGDLFVFNAASGQDVVVDFSSLQGDKIWLKSGLNGSNITSAVNALTHISSSVNGAVIDLGGGHTITLTGVAANTLTVNDFVIF